MYNTKPLANHCFSYNLSIFEFIISGTGVLCEKKCPSLVSDSLDIKCSHNGNYVNCSNLSTPGTIAIPSCKPTHTVPNGQDEVPLELLCQENGMWNNQLYRCIPCNYIFLLYYEHKFLTYLHIF